MPLLQESSEAKKFDTRMIERNVSRGVVSAGDVEKAVKSISDDSDNAEWVNLDVVATGDGIRKVPANGTLEANAVLSGNGG